MFLTVSEYDQEMQQSLNAIYDNQVQILTLEINLDFLGSTVVECLTWDWGVAGWSLTGVTVLCP